MSERIDILLMRHSYDDHSYIDGLNDARLTSGGVEMAKEASKAHAPGLGGQYESGLALRVSSKRRAIETAEIFAEELERHKIEHNITVDPRLRELYQGNMIGLEGKTHEERVRMLELGWEIFERERIAGNDDYKYGTPDLTDDKYNEFNRFIAPPYGESQNELSSRIENGFKHAIEEVLPAEHTPLFIAHRGTIREILNIALAHNKGCYDIKQNPHIEMAGWKYCEMFKTSLDDVQFSLRALTRNRREKDETQDID